LSATYGDGDSDSDLYPENVIPGPGERRVMSDISFKMKVIDISEIAKDVLSHSVKCNLIDETVIGYGSSHFRVGEF